MTTGSAGNTVAGTPAGSLGKYISQTPIPDNTLDNLFPDMTGDQNAQSGPFYADYRCVFLLNNHASITLQNAVLWVTSQVAGGANVLIAPDPTAISPVGQAGVQAVSIVNGTAVPAGVNWATYSTGTGLSQTNTAISKATGIPLGSIPAQSCVAFWYQRIAQNSTAVNSDGLSVQISGDTTA